MGGAVNFIADPLDIFDGKADDLVTFGYGTDKLEDEVFGNDIGMTNQGDPIDMEALIAQALAQSAVAAADPNLKPFRRPKPAADTAEGVRADRRRSVSAAMRRRAASSILTSGSGGEKLGV